MLNICNRMADDNSTCDSIAAVAQIALFTINASDRRMLRPQSWINSTTNVNSLKNHSLPLTFCKVSECRTSKITSECIGYWQFRYQQRNLGLYFRVNIYSESCRTVRSWWRYTGDMILVMRMTLRMKTMMMMLKLSSRTGKSHWWTDESATKRYQQNFSQKKL